LLSVHRIIFQEFKDLWSIHTICFFVQTINRPWSLYKTCRLHADTGGGMEHIQATHRYREGGMEHMQATRRYREGGMEHMLLCPCAAYISMDAA
jgi:hypothetical protein